MQLLFSTLLLALASSASAGGWGAVKAVISASSAFRSQGTNVGNSNGGWTTFSKADRADLKISFEGLESENYYVTVPCPFVWFKLFLFGADGAQTSHIELFANNKGNIFCNKGGSKNWHGGQRTDFSLAQVCASGSSSVQIRIEKDAQHVAIYSGEDQLYRKAFGAGDGDCGVASARVTTQVWDNAAQLFLGLETISAFPRIPFSKEKNIDIKVSFDGAEDYYVKVPCPFVWFKLSLYGADGAQTSHIELFTRSRGNIFCNKGGSKNMDGGQKSYFGLANICLPGLDSVIVHIQKDAKHVSISNKGVKLYNKDFGGSDGDCSVASARVVTQVPESDETLYLSNA